jgi:hypothetical protein
LYDADDSVVALAVGADAARITVGNVVADAAKERISLEFLQRLCQRCGNGFIAPQQEIDQAAGGFGANARQFGEGVNKFTYGFSE